MIIEKILEAILGVVNWLLGLLPELTIDIPKGIVEVAGNVFYGVSYFIPFDHVLPILAVSFGVIGFRIIYATVLRIKSFIPTMGA